MVNRLVSSTLCLFVAMLATPASAGLISYSTTGSKLSCGSDASCSQLTPTSVAVGGITLTYNFASGVSVISPAVINLGNILTTGTGTSASLTGIQLMIDINDLTLGATGFLPTGSIVGTISTNNSVASFQFSPNNTTTATFGTLPGVALTGMGLTDTYQILNTTLGVQAPTVGNPVGQTSIQGGVVQTNATVTVPEPASIALVGIGLLAAVGAARRKRHA